MFKTGFKQWPELYAMCVYMTIATGLMTHTVYNQLKHKDFISRYKRVYHGKFLCRKSNGNTSSSVVRPNDPRLALYPRRYVTDKQYLPKDHPETTIDLKHTQLPAVNVHRYDPTVRGKGRDRD